MKLSRDYIPTACVDECWGTCGVSILYHLEQGPQDAVFAVFYCGGAPLIVFSDAVVRGITHGRLAQEQKRLSQHGKRLVKYIKRHRLGPVTGSVTAVNTNDPCRNRIKVWTWRPNHAALEAWAKKNIEGEE